MRKRKKGWFKKARKRFTSERIFSWTLSHYRDRFSHQIEASNDGEISLRYDDRSEKYQVINAIHSLGFTDGFWKARAYAKEHDNNWCFSFDKIIKV